MWLVFLTFLSSFVIAVENKWCDLGMEENEGLSELLTQNHPLLIKISTLYHIFQIFI